jgi:hypothetical protein
MKTGDEVSVIGKPEYGIGKIVRFYANHGTVLVNFEKTKNLAYCNYESLTSNENRR